MSQNPYESINGKIIDIIDESPTIKTFVVVPEEEFKFETGQFVELTLPGEGEAPFTPSSSPADRHLQLRPNRWILVL
jgi:NAD(P)H-flavin reductase